MKPSRGFTLIELIVVLAIVAVLGATAAPKFFNLQKEARKSAVNELRKAVDSARVMAAAVLVANASPASSSLTIEGSTVTMGSGYPLATAGGILNAVRIDSSVFTTVVGPSTNPVISSGMVYFGAKAATTFSTCGFTYSDAATTSGQTAFTSTPVLTGC